VVFELGGWTSPAWARRAFRERRKSWTRTPMEAETMEPKIVRRMEPAYLSHEDDGLAGSSALAPPVPRQASDRSRPESTLRMDSLPRLKSPWMLRVRS
jgi:hypothetical protein